MARAFNGSSDKIAVGIKSVLQTANISVSLWANPATLTDNQTLLGYDKNTGQAYNLSIGIIAAGKVEFNSYNGSWFSASGASSLLTATAWNNLVGTYDGTTMRLYVNGTVTGTPATLASIDYNMGVGTGLFFGEYDNHGAGANWFGGSLAEIAIWNVALDASEIAALAKGHSPASIRPAASLGYWPLIGRTSPEIEIINGSGGTLTGTSNADHPRIIMPRSRRISYFAPPPLRQVHYRFRTDAGAVDATPTWGAAEDTNGFDPGTSNFRLRVSVNNSGSGSIGAQPFELYLSKNAGAYAPITTSSTGGVKSANAGSDADDTVIKVPRLTPGA